MQAVEHGASVFVYQTNNADFRGTDENLQQLASARLRAIETGRSVVNVSTVGTSEIILADGTTVASLPVDTAGVLSAAVPERTGTTLAVLIGPALQLILIGAALAGLAMTTVVSRTLPPQRPPRGRGPRGR